MGSVSSEVIIQWKRLWQLVSGIYYETPQKSVEEELLSVSKELQDGLLQFKKSASSQSDLERLLKERKQEKLLAFTQRLQDLLDLETGQCWEILCYYLANEYRGSAGSLTTFISTETQMTKLLDDIWGYYTLERMTMLKIVKNLLIYYKVPNYPYHHQYKNVVDRISLKMFRDSYLKQLEYLISEIPPPKLTAGEFFNYQAKLIAWSERNAREINEVLHILLLIFEHISVEAEQVKRLFHCFKQHCFGKQQRYFESTNSFHEELRTRLAYSEVTLFLKCIDFDESETASQDTIQDIIKSLNNDITSICNTPEHGPVFLTWMLLNFRCTNNLKNESTFGQFGKRALALGCFDYLKSLITHSMFKDDSLVSQIVRKTIYNQLNYLCDLFDADGSCARHPYIYELLAELISMPILAEEFCQQENGVKSLFNTLLEVFPIDFVHLSMVAHALTVGGMGNYVKSQLESLPILTAFYDEAKISLRMISDNEYILCNDFYPFQRNDFTIPSGTSAIVMERPEGYCVHFRKTVNYFNVLHHEINCLLTEAIHLHHDFHSTERLKHVNSGLKYLVAALLRTENLSSISVEMVHPTEMCIDLLNKFKSLQSPPLDLMANCLNVCTSLLPLADNEIFTRVINLNILPVITNTMLDDYKMYAQGVCFDSQLLGTYLVDVEKKVERYDFLLAYLNFLRTYTKMQRNRLFEVEIPGLIFLLREVFCHMHAWRFKVSLDQNNLYAEIMGFICDILDVVSLVNSKDSNEKKTKLLLRNICVYSLLNLENGLVLLKFIALGNGCLQYNMELEPNWMLQPTTGLIWLVRLSMRILMQLLRLKTTVFEASALSPLEALIYTQPKQRDTLRIIPVVTSYMSNIFDRWLPILSCRLLKRIALEFNMSLLTCLDMEPDQIRMIFLQKLPDPLENDFLKIAILDLVEACIEKQPGVTEVFFKVNLTNEKRMFRKDKGIAESILTFMEDYLEAVEKDAKTVQNALPSRIMNIFHSLWRMNMQSLVEQLTKRPNFWKQLCRPLLGPLLPNVRAYTQLLNIWSIEIYCTQGEPPSQLCEEVVKFFEPSHFKEWLKYAFHMPKVPTTSSSFGDEFTDDTPEWLSRLQAFKDLILILLRKQPRAQIEIQDSQLELLAESCLNVLLERANYILDLRPFIILSEMYLIILLNFKHTFTKTPEKDQHMLDLLNQLLNRIASCYGDIHVRSKVSCLSIAIKSADFLASELRKNSSGALSFLSSAVSIICSELQNLENSVKIEIHTKTNPELKGSSSSLILSLNLLKTIAVIFHNEGPGNWDLPFVANKVCQRLLSSVSSIVQLYSKQALSVELLDVLIIFAKGNCSNEFLYCDVSDYLWLKMLPPKQLLQNSYSLTEPPTDDWTVQKWWPIYARGIELVTTLLQKHTNYFLKDVIQFVGIHEEYLMDSLLLSKQSLEPTALQLIKNTAMLIASLVDFENQWRLDHSQSLFNIMRCIQMLMGHSISMFHQPKSLKYLMIGWRSQVDVLQAIENDYLAEDVVVTLDSLTEVIILCARCLRCFSPTLRQLICEPEFLSCKWEPIFEIHFGAPKLSENAVGLSFGTVLSIVGVYTKVLTLQNYGFHNASLNDLPEDVPIVGNEGTAIVGTSTDTRVVSSPRTFMKSLSATSASSVSATPNELLCSLDGELCLMALEHILYLAASQSMLALKNTQLVAREKQLIRREISTELVTYHEFVRRKILFDLREHKVISHRRKRGQAFMNSPVMDANQDVCLQNRTSITPVVVRNGSSNSMRVNVVRRLHLQHQKQEEQKKFVADAFEMTQSISPIGQLSSKGPTDPLAVSSTPHLTHTPVHNQREFPPRVNFSKRIQVQTDTNNYNSAAEEEETEADIECFPPDDHNFSLLSYVQLAEEDYLHLMSNLFTFICQSD